MLSERDLDERQQRAIDFIDEGEDSLLVADVGTGKTVIALSAGRRACHHGDVYRWLVLAPKLVALDAWANEPGEWEHLQDVTVAIATGDPKQRKAAIESTAQFVVLNYENLPWLMKEYPKKRGNDTLPFDGLICDEIDKIKTVSTNRFKDIRHRLGRFRKRVGLTGTLVPNDLTELWGQLFLVDNGETFANVEMPEAYRKQAKRVGRSFYNWRKAFFFPTDYEQRNWSPFPDTEERLLAALDGLVFRLPQQGIPPVVWQEPTRLIMPPVVRDRYDELERDFMLAFRGKNMTEVEIEAVNSGVLSGKLQQITAGFTYDGEKITHWHHKLKFDWLDGIYRKHLEAGEQLLVFYHFQAEMDELARRYPGLPSLGSKVPDKKKMDNIAAWNRGDIPMMALHPASAGHGLNLQKSGAHNIALLTIPWSGGLLKQLLGRLARRGQTAEQVNVWTCVYRDSVDEDVLGVATGRLDRLHGFQDKLYERQGANAGAH